MSAPPVELASASPPSGDGTGPDAAVPPPRTGSRTSAWMAIAALIVAALATPYGGQIGGADFGQVLAGRLEVRTGDGWVGVVDGAGVPSGSLVRAAGEEVRIGVAGAELTLADGGELLADAAGPELRRGSLLVDAAEDWTLRLGATSIRGRGQWRVDTGVASRVATYAGRAELDDGARTASLARYRQAPVRDGAIEDGRRPLRYLVGDAWDERLLADAFAVDRLAERLGDSLARSHGDEPRSPQFYAAFAAVEESAEAALEGLATVEEDGRYGPPADVLLGVTVADTLVEGAAMDADNALERMIRLRRAGATWGLVLVEHELASSDLRAAADRALERVEADPPPAEPDVDAGTDEGVGDGTGAPGAADEADTADPAPAPPPGSAPSPGPSPTPAPPPEDDGDDGGPLQPVEDAVREVEDSVGDLLDGTTDAVDEVVGGVTGLLGD
jgi:hypothetical protein